MRMSLMSFRLARWMKVEGELGGDISIEGSVEVVLEVSGEDGHES